MLLEYRLFPKEIGMKFVSLLLSAALLLSSTASALEGKPPPNVPPGPPAGKPPVTPAGAPPGPPTFVLGLVGAAVAVAVIAGLVSDDDNPPATATAVR
jgi:hypothetical protein